MCRQCPTLYNSAQLVSTAVRWRSAVRVRCSRAVKFLLCKSLSFALLLRACAAAGQLANVLPVELAALTSAE